MRKYWLPIAMLVALATMFAGSASAIQLKYTGEAYNRSFGSYYVGPYSVKINPTGDSWASGSTNWNSQPAVAAVCNDFSGRISTGDVWDVTVHEMTVADLGPPAPHAKFWGNSVTDTVNRGDSASTIDLVDYQAAAWLSDRLLTYHNNWNPTTPDLVRTRLQYAIWTIFNMNATTGVSDAEIEEIAGYRQDAFNAVSDGYTGGGWKVFTENPVSGPKQEMMVRVPEAASFASLGLNFGALVLLGFAFRRRFQ